MQVGDHAVIGGLTAIHQFWYRAIKEAYRLIYRSALNLQQAVEQIRSDLPETPEVSQLVAFVTSSPRGIIK